MYLAPEDDWGTLIECTPPVGVADSRREQSKRVATLSRLEPLAPVPCVVTLSLTPVSRV